MWAVIFLSIWLMGVNNTTSKAIIILDDCKNWRISQYTDSPYERFALSNNHFKYNNFVALTHLIPDPPEGELSKIRMAFSEILQQDPLYSSDLSFGDWQQLEDQYGKIYILHPDDYCSGQRFVFNPTFTLYEVGFLFPVYE